MLDNVTVKKVSKASITMVAIVKNEEAVLERCIESVKSIVDEFVIVDTGSTDGTKDIIKKYGKLYELPYTVEVETKQKALALATGDYIILMDADEWVAANVEKLRQYADAGVSGVSTRIHDVSGAANTVTLKYYRKRLFKNDGTCKYTGPKTHGYLRSPKPDLQDKTILVNHCHDHKAGVKTNKIERTLAPLTQAVKDNPTDTRAHFYLARTLMGKELRRFDEAIATFEHYLAMPNSNFGGERWWAQFNIAQCYGYVGNLEKSLEACDKAIEMDRKRAEAYVLKGMLYYNKQAWNQASLFFEHAMEMDEPDSILFLDPRQYWEVPADYLATCYDKMGNTWKALELTRELVGKRSYVDKRLIKNIEAYEKHLNIRSTT